MTKIDNVNNDALTLSVDMDVVKKKTSRIFTKDNGSWSPNPEYNVVFLRAQQAYANDVLFARGHIFLNEVYDELGFPRTAIGAVVGWRKTGTGYINFGDFGVESSPGSIELTFNVDGPILDLI